MGRPTAPLAASEVSLRAELGASLGSVINNLSQGVCLFDADARLVACNDTYLDIYELSPQVVKPGCTLLDLLRHRKDVGLLAEDPQEYANAILQSIEKKHITTWLIETRDGRFVHCKNHPLANGGWVTTHEDITERRRAELTAEAARAEAEAARNEADAAREQLLDAFDVVPEGLALFDPQDRLVLWNKRYAELYSATTNISAGVKFEELLRDGIAHGQYPAAVGREKEFLADRLARHDRPRSSMEQQLAGGRWVRVEERKTADGGRIGVRVDITELKHREQSLRLLFEANPIPMVVFSPEDFRFLAVNQAAALHYGYSRKQFLSLTALDIRPPEERERFKRVVGRPTRGRAGHHVKADGTRIDVLTYSVPIDYEGIRARLTAIVDVTERNKLESQLRDARGFLDSIIEHIPVGLTVKNASDSKYVLLNGQAEESLGLSRENVLGKTPWDVLPRHIAEQASKDDAKLLASRGKKPSSSTLTMETPRGVRSLKVSRAVMGKRGSPKYLLAVVEDVTDRIEAEARISYLAHHDALTNLPNRHTFELYLAPALRRARANGESIAVIYIGLDHFKETNDLFGTAVGDAVLCEVANRLTGSFHESFVARMGGDEFALVCGAAQPLAAEELASRIQARLAEEIVIEGNRLRIDASIGISIFPADAQSISDLIGNADAALERAKADGRRRIRFFDPTVDRELRERRAMHHDLRFALERGEISLEYQPQFTRDRRPIGFEALARWRHPIHGSVPPAVFIPLAEEGGFVLALGEWILHEACREAASWSNALLVSVNLSPLQFRQEDLVGMVRATLERTGLAAERLELEITEGALQSDRARAVAMLHDLKALGVRIAVDDFGIGYSSLSRLKDFPLDKIKLDRSFVADLHLDAESGPIAQAIISLGHALGVSVLAEGVETEEQLAILTRQACDQLQGYLLGRPMPIDRYAQIIGPRLLKGRVSAPKVGRRRVHHA